MRPHLYMLDAHGEPVPTDDVVEWGRWLEQSGDQRLVARDRDEGPNASDIFVSTVFLGIDHAHFGGPPLLYETMVFGGPLHEEQQRYSTRADALVGHQEMCARVRAALEKR